MKTSVMKSHTEKHFSFSQNDVAKLIAEHLAAEGFPVTPKDVKFTIVNSYDGVGFGAADYREGSFSAKVVVTVED